MIIRFEIKILILINIFILKLSIIYILRIILANTRISLKSEKTPFI